jgi:hypothetical protein
MRTSGQGSPPDHGLGPAARAIGRADRIRAWLVTGPLGRAIAFGLDFLAALRQALGGRSR